MNVAFSGHCCSVSRLSTRQNWRHARTWRPHASLGEQSSSESTSASTTDDHALALRSSRAQPSALVQKFEPYLLELRAELRGVAIEAAAVVTGANMLDSGPSDSDSDDADRVAERCVADALSESQRIGVRIGSLLKLIKDDLMPRMPTDSEALFLAASAYFISNHFDAALQLLQRSLMAEQRVLETEVARRHYLVALCVIRLLDQRTTSAEVRKATGCERLSARRREELLSLMESSLLTAIRLGPAGFFSPYIDIDYYARLRHGDEQLGAVAQLSKRLADEAASTGRYWRNGWQRPSHFLRGLRSQPFYDAGELDFAPSLLRMFATIREEVLGTLAPPRGAQTSAWDAVGSKHDACDRDLAEGGVWKEVVLLNGDDKVAASTRSNRKRCPRTAALLDEMFAASDLARVGIGECTFSALGPGAHLQPHCGSTNARLTVHLPLIVPQGCSIRVGDELRTYREGELLVFDDSWEHEVWNRHEADQRVVLLIRFWHVDLQPCQYAATKREMKHHLARHRRTTTMPPL
uniref:Aspartyl/asparaginy/proline hydroxylase domain-containing protein n=1 Tax=Coccolithus braarudii TaxID=221442 RepID=A0A7S0L3U4_9EUKA|mmetsp:Transcript_1600/g.3475  ORF Transcript_1600/g.3475 Transcript_1600/m.3475 type:complete len:523 (+) Transcript_1600:111-1679(+)